MSREFSVGPAGKFTPVFLWESQGLSEMRFLSTKVLSGLGRPVPSFFPGKDDPQRTSLHKAVPPVRRRTPEPVGGQGGQGGPAFGQSRGAPRQLLSSPRWVFLLTRGPIVDAERSCPGWAALSSVTGTTLPLSPRALPWKPLQLQIKVSRRLSPGCPAGDPPGAPDSPQLPGEGSSLPKPPASGPVCKQKRSLGVALLRRAFWVAFLPWARE